MQNRRNSLFLLAAALLGVALAVPAAEAYRLMGKPAPNFALKGTSGVNFRLSEYRGDVVALAFWGSRCGTCGEQLGALSRMINTYQSAGLTVLAVNVDDDQVAAASFAAVHPVAFPMLLDPAKGVARKYQVDNLPMLLLIDRSGAIRYLHRNYRSGSDTDYLNQIRVLLDE